MLLDDLLRSLNGMLKLVVAISNENVRQVAWMENMSSGCMLIARMN